MSSRWPKAQPIMVCCHKYVSGSEWCTRSSPEHMIREHSAAPKARVHQSPCMEMDSAKMNSGKDIYLLMQLMCHIVSLHRHHQHVICAGMDTLLCDSFSTLAGNLLCQ